MTKLVLKSLGTLLLASTCLHAEEGNNFNGTYLGADIGIEDGGDLYYGGHLGYRHRTNNNLVFGAEGSFGDFSSSLETASFSSSIDHTWSATAHVGFVVDKNNLFYVGAGYQEVRASISGLGLNASGSSGGVRGLVGYERAIYDGLNVRLQGSFNDVDGADVYVFTSGLSLSF